MKKYTHDCLHHPYDAGDPDIPLKPDKSPDHGLHRSINRDDGAEN